ncbi:macro domain-containing protein VPA0103-like isoform X3 [Zingiber officinale]|uniref:macro domain-containing protein VPA0103-like isoform X3 n=1 Tax=Zingiber officinale TaxID=94328 RepID=UPI001C4BDE33|nr:macro domain-containing protein VPA0103-like isoform X3 [Zingiber officinale]
MRSVVKEDLFEIQTWYREEARLSHMTSEILPQCDRLEIVFGIIRLLISGAKHIEGIRISFNQFEQLNFLRVNAANEQMLGGGGVDGAIHRAAGPELLDACRKVPEVRRGVRCPTGEARITPAFQLPVSHVIHTVGPIYDVDEHPEVSLSNAYRNSLKLAKENNIQYIAFPAISCGVYRYPSKEASRIAISVLKEFPDAFKEIHFVLFSDELYGVWLESASNDTGLQLLA